MEGRRTRRSSGTYRAPVEQSARERARRLPPIPDHAHRLQHHTQSPTQRPHPSSTVNRPARARVRFLGAIPCQRFEVLRIHDSATQRGRLPHGGLGVLRGSSPAALVGRSESRCAPRSLAAEERAAGRSRAGGGDERPRPGSTGTPRGATSSLGEIRLGSCVGTSGRRFGDLASLRSVGGVPVSSEPVMPSSRQTLGQAE